MAQINSSIYTLAPQHIAASLATQESGLDNASIIMNLLYFSNILSVVVPILLSVAFMTIIERKILAAMQRRLGPTDVGYFGVLQPFSDALKLILKESVVPAQSNKILFYLAPVVTLVFSLLG